ncbi:MAG: penicillin-binding protein activator [Mariprofundaceae bacterium]
MDQARSGEMDIESALEALDALAASSPAPLAEEAAFRKIELMLEAGWPGAPDAADTLLAVMPDHALAPYARFWLATYWMNMDEPARALEQMELALEHPRLTRELLERMLAVGPELAQAVDATRAVRWLLDAARLDPARRDAWLRLAARRTAEADGALLAALHAEPPRSPDWLARFDLHLGRLYLLNGASDALAGLVDLLAGVRPDAPELATMRGWIAGKGRPATIGVLLPLSGKYARYGEETLRGLRMAMMRAGGRMSLRIEDTAGDPARALAGWRRLTNEGADIVIGPLLASCARAVAGALVAVGDDTPPVIALTGRVDVAARAAPMFVHTLSPLAQVDFLAGEIRRAGAEKVVVIAGESAGEQAEADAFARAFESLGGAVAAVQRVSTQALDQRDALRQLRSETDDDELLAELDEDLAVFLPPLDVEIRMPVNFDALYLALPGRVVALLAGQLAWADIRGVPLWGSTRWQDGHLLDDRGRYLGMARFAGLGFAMDGLAGARLPAQLVGMYRESWGEPEPPKLTVLAWDTARIAFVLTSRLGLRGRELAEELHNPEGFPALTGQVRFDARGVGQKRMDLFGIRGGRIVPAG